MKKVVDSNYFNSPELYDFLVESEENFAILTEYAAIEAYKGTENNVQGISDSMGILSKFPKQVLVLKGAMKICGMELLESNLPDSLIDEEQTNIFNEFCSHLEISKTNPEIYKSDLLKKQDDANVQMARIKSNAPKLLEGLKAVEKIYTTNEIKMIRKRDFSKDLLAKILDNTLLMTIILMEDHPSVTMIPEFDLLPYNFLFRQALCFKMLFFRWIVDSQVMVTTSFSCKVTTSKYLYY